MLIEQLIDFEKVRTENLKFRTDLRDRVMNVWSVTQQMNVYKGRLLKKIFKSKIEARPVKFYRWSLHALQTSHFIFDRFGSKLWLQSIQA